MALKDLDITPSSNDGAVMTIIDPINNVPVLNDDGTPMTIRLAGIDSDRYKKAEQASINRRLSMGGRRGGGKPTAQELEQATLSALVAATISWDVTFEPGQKLEYNEQNVRSVYSKFSWLKEQVEDFVNTRANFAKASTTT